MVRLSRLMPRSLILLLLLTALWLGKDVVLRRYLVEQLESSFGAKVELAQLQTNFGSGRVCLKGLKIVDPRLPAKNLVQADIAYLKLDWNRLWNREFVVTEGQTNGLIINAPGTESSGPSDGLNQIEPALDPDQFATQQDQLDLATEAIGRRLLDQTKPGSVNVADPSIKLDSTSREILQRWETDIARLEDQAKQLAPALEKMRDSIAEQRNFFHPLRDKERIQNAIHEIELLQAQAGELKTEINRGLEQLAADQKEVKEVANQDVCAISEFKFENQFDDQLISELLLHRESQELIDEIVVWLNWFHNAIPLSGSELQGSEKGGAGLVRSVEFAVPSPIPTQGVNWRFEKIDLEGSGWFAGHHLNFCGAAFNLAAMPDSRMEPTHFELRALGKNDLQINCSIDRGGDQVDSNLKMQFQDMELGRKPMGDSHSMLVSTGSNRRANADIDLEINGVAVTGKVELCYTEIAMHLDSLSDVLGGAPARSHLNKGISQINQFHSVLELSGTTEKLSMNLQSDLGKQINGLIESVVVNQFAQEKEKYLRRIEETNGATQRYLEKSIGPRLAQINEVLVDEINRIAEIKEYVAPIGESGWRKLR